MHPAFSQISYLKSAHLPNQWPEDSGYEVVFAGRSNVGKSSAINAIVNQRKLARTSKTPGRTQHIMFYTMTDECRLVDLPGYGYAKVPEKLRQHWGRTLEKYLETRDCLRGLILPVDARHPNNKLDLKMLSWCDSLGLAVHVLLTKSDKLSKNKAASALRQFELETSNLQQCSAQLFSSVSLRGVDQARAVILNWIKLETP